MSSGDGTGGGTGTGTGTGDASETVGTLLADIARLLDDTLRAFHYAGKQHWGLDEHEQVHALEEALDEARKDFQEMAPLVNGQVYYANDRRGESLRELRALRTQFTAHAQTFKDWLRTGGPINPLWIRETGTLKSELHRAQRRAVQRIYAATHQEDGRCLGAFLVFRQQRQDEAERERQRLAREELPPWQQQQQQQQQQHEQAHGTQAAQHDARPEATRRGSMEQLVPTCNAVGRFERFGERDIAFICDFCDGHIIWENLASMPAARTPRAPGSTQPHWQAGGNNVPQDGEPAETKTIVFAPLAIANHRAPPPPPPPGDWMARLTCPFCDNYTYYDQGDDSEDELRWVQDDGGFEDLQSFQEHLEWTHTAVTGLALPAMPTIPTIPKEASNCVLM